LHQVENGQEKLQTELSLQQKSEVLLCIQKGESQRKLAEQSGVSKTTIANIKKNEHSTINSVESNCSPNRKSMVFKGESSKGGKFAKERQRVMLCCSATGEKLKPFVIGNTARPRTFKQNSVTPDNLPVTWKHNKKAWMTTCVFEDWLNQLRETMKKKNRRIILFVVNATSHVVSKKLNNVHVKFLPPYLTSELQPLDQGIIQAMKANYRKSMLHSLLAAVGKFNTATEFAKSVTVYDAMQWIRSP